MDSINNDAESPGQTDGQSENDIVRMKSSDDRSDSTPSCSVFARKNYFETLTITKEDELTYASCGALNNTLKPRKKPCATG